MVLAPLLTQAYPSHFICPSFTSVSFVLAVHPPCFLLHFATGSYRYSVIFFLHLQFTVSHSLTQHIHCRPESMLAHPRCLPIPTGALRWDRASSQPAPCPGCSTWPCPQHCTGSCCLRHTACLQDHPCLWHVRSKCWTLLAFFIYKFNQVR